MLVLKPFALSFVTLCGIINKMPQCQFPIFRYFCVSEKLDRKYSQNWTKQKLNLLFLPKLRGDRRGERGGPRASHTIGQRG
jgi:hypothetical protein